MALQKILLWPREDVSSDAPDLGNGNVQNVNQLLVCINLKKKKPWLNEISSWMNDSETCFSPTGSCF